MSSCPFYYSRGTELRPQDGFKITAIISPLPPECWVTARTTQPSSFYAVMLGLAPRVLCTLEKHSAPELHPSPRLPHAS